MCHGNNEAQHVKRSLKCKRKSSKAGILILSLILLITTVVGGTLAYLITKTDSIKNTFNPSSVESEITEEFDGTYKRNVNVKNTGDIDAYVRVKLVTYRVKGDNQHIGGTAEIPAFIPGDGWVKNGGYYYYTKPVAPGEKPAANLIDEIALVSYDDADGGKQVIEVMAEAIQANGVDADGTKAVVKAWGVDPETLK